MQEEVWQDLFKVSLLGDKKKKKRPVAEYNKQTLATDSLSGGQITKANVITNEGQL